MRFEGFQESDFESFAIPEFGGRMAAIRAGLRPKLVALGQELAAPFGELCGLPTFPHVAQHMRRRVHPPAETWVAFCRDRKGYKRWTHLRVAVSVGGVRITVFVEDDADDKPGFAERLRDGAAELLRELGPDNPLLWYTLGSPPPRGTRLDPSVLVAGAARLGRLKLEHFYAGIPLPRTQAVESTPEELITWARTSAARLMPLYMLGATLPGPR